MQFSHFFFEGILEMNQPLGRLFLEFLEGGIFKGIRAPHGFIGRAGENAIQFSP